VGCNYAIEDTAPASGDTDNGSVDGDTDADTGADADGHSDVETDADTGADADGHSDAETDADTGEDTDGDSDVIVTFHNGIYWNDTSGNRIEAHGAGIIQVDDTWYWIGEDKSHNSSHFRAVNCYASKNLSDWEFRNAIITRDTHPLLNTSDRIIERPKVIYNDKTGKYVVWLHWDGNSYADAEAGVFVSDTIDGDYAYVKDFRPYNNMSRDDTLFKDDDGTAYFLSAANNNYDLVLYQLTDDYLDVARQVDTLWPGGHREAPAVMKHDGTYYIITSGCTGWDPNQGQYAAAPSMEGPWSSLQNIGDSTTYDSQPTYVIPVYGTQTTTYIYAGDRWQDPDLKSSKYIWLPIMMNGRKLGLNFYEQWQLNVTTGEWSAYDEYIPQSGWSLVYVDSEETIDEDGHAVNAFDGMASTYWHTEWQSEGPHAPLPHEIQIDLGDKYVIEGMRYLPRQTVEVNGTIARYEFYAGLSTEDWGAPVASGTWAANQQEKRVTFEPVTARYIRLVALSEINGGDWTSVAELDLVGELANKGAAL
jgi:hypothetical protein